MDSEHLELKYVAVKPEKSLTDIVESIWMVRNYSGESTTGIIIPDGKIDLFLFDKAGSDFELFISGICTQPVIKPPFPHSTMFAISFYPVAAEYIFKQSFSGLKNTSLMLPADYWGFSVTDLTDFDNFCKKACRIITGMLTKEIDYRKKNLFELIYTSKGEISVKELSEKTGWSSRQINRYFNAWLGITLKSYINVIRFSNSLKQLKNGDFYPELNYVDQSHFIREVKKFSGVKPTVLGKNENDRFIQLSLLPKD
ncbi:AraC family transcriptional regulator [Fluviicola sp.]|uniref:AraC family transcriptional regulator n=1 Tax=Fluviicola sp. TaxID=1917219 RepID=UPI0031D991D6